GVGHGLFPRLQRDRNGNRLLAGLYARALINVEHRDIGDELAIDALRRAQYVGRVDRAVDHEGEIALHRLERGKLQDRPCAGCLRPRLRDFVQDHLEGDQWAFGVERLEWAGVQLAEMPEHVLRADLDLPGASRMKPR